MHVACCLLCAASWCRLDSSRFASVLLLSRWSSVHYAATELYRDVVTKAAHHLFHCLRVGLCS